MNTSPNKEPNVTSTDDLSDRSYLEALNQLFGPMPKPLSPEDQRYANDPEAYKRLDELKGKLAATDQPWIEIPAYLDDTSNHLYHAGPTVVWSYAGIVCKAEIPEGSTAAATYAQQQPRLAKMIDAALPQTLRTLTMLEVVNGPSPDDEDQRSDTGDAGTQVMAESAFGHTTFFRGDVNETQANLDHELGHNAGRRGGPINPYEWAEAAKADEAHTLEEYGAHRGSLNGGFATGQIGIDNYGMYSITEDWAEAVRLFTKDWRKGTIGYLKGQPLRFAETFPNRDRLIRQWLKMPATGKVA